MKTQNTRRLCNPWTHFSIFSLSLILGCIHLTAQSNDTLLSKVYRWDGLEAKKENGRIRRPVLLGHSFALSHLEIHASTVKAGKAPHPPHKHADQEELIIVKEGQVKISINDKSQTLGAGSVALIMPEDMHGIENVGKTPASYYILRFKSRRPMDLDRGKRAGGSIFVNRNDLAVINTGKGERRNYFDRATSQLKQHEMHTTLLNVGFDSHAPHTHVKEEIVLILKGDVEMNIDNKLHKASVGDVVFLSSNIPHALINVGKVACEYFAFQWEN